MTTATFQAIGTSIGTAIGGPIGGAIGGWIGAGVGAYVDNQIITALLAPDPPRLADLNVQVSTYGRPIPLLFGEGFRLSGNVIWSTGLVATKRGGKGAPEPEHYTYSASFAVLLGEGLGDGEGYERVEKIWANGKLIHDESIAVLPLPATNTTDGYFLNKGWGTFALMDTLRFYPGSRTQPVDPTIQADVGIDECQNYRRSCYVVLAGLQLADYGNRLPNLEFLVRAKTGETVGGAARRIVVRCGIAAETVSTSMLTQPLRGYVIGNQGNGVGGLQPLALAYSFDLVEVWGSLRLQPRGTGLAGIIDAKWMGAHNAGSAHEEPIRWPRLGETQTAQAASITFSDPERDYQKNTQQASRVSGTSDVNAGSEVALTLTADEGQRLADRLLWENVMGRQLASVALPDRYLGLEPGRAYLVDTARGRQRIKLVQSTRGVNGISRMELRRDRPEVYQGDNPGASVPTRPNEVSLPGETLWQPLDISIMREADNDSGFYWAVTGPSDGWRGMDLWRALTDPGGFTHVDKMGTETVIGDCIIGALADGPTHIWDEASELNVEVSADSDELSSATELEVYNGANMCWVGDQTTGQGELLQFRTAELIGVRQYKLTGLLRGRFGTEHETAGHLSTDRFVLIQEDGMQRSDFGSTDWNRERYYAAPSLLQQISDADLVPFTNTGEGKKPYSPVDLESSRDGSNNLTLAWTRRSRIPAPGLGYGPTPLGEAVEAYEVDIIVAGIVKRTITAATPTVAYSAANQTTDGITPGNPVSGIIYQLSDIRGRGHGAAFTV